MNNFENIERAQSREEVEALLREAFEKQLLCDLVIENSDGPSLTADCLVEDMNGSDLMVAYLCEGGDLGESIPVNSSRIKKVVTKDSFQ